MKFIKKQLPFLGLLFAVLFACNIEPYEGEIPETEIQLSCEDAVKNTATAATNFIDVAPSNAGYAALCSAYKKALENQVKSCGDSGGSFQALIDSLNCEENDDDDTTGDTSGDYWPMFIGNKWTYNYKINGISQPESSIKIDGIIDYQGVSSYFYENFFGAIQGTDGTGLNNLSVTYYTRKNNGDYHILIGELNAELAGTYKIKQEPYDYIILKDYLDVGATWTKNFQLATSYESLSGGLALPDVLLNYEMNFEILAKNISIVSNGVTFTNVIKLGFKQKTSIQGLPTSSATANYTYYFAKDIGPVKIEGTVFDADDNITSTVLQEVIKYNLG